MLETSKIAIVALAVIVGLGGLMGFLKAKSKASLIAGIGSALALIGSLLLVGSNVRGGLLAAFSICIALEVIFYVRMKKTGKPMPGGPMLVCCLVAQYFILQGVPPATGSVEAGASADKPAATSAPAPASHKH